jgi:hypothetical protein
MYQNGTFRRIFELFQIHNLSLLSLAGALLASACSASLNDSAPSDTDRQLASEQTGNSVTDTNTPITERFRTLDQYLAHLEQFEGPVDGPWYKEISPGLYELQTGNLHLDTPDKQKRTFTRAELEKKFGFTK